MGNLNRINFTNRFLVIFFSSCFLITFFILIFLLLGSRLNESVEISMSEHVLGKSDRNIINNKAVGLMGSFRYEEAVGVLETLAVQRSDDSELLINYAIAVLNRQGEGDELKSLDIVSKIIDREPENYRAHYLAGVIKLYLEDSSEALPHFQKVVMGDPKDAYAHYHVGQLLNQKGNLKEALGALNQNLSY